MKEKFNDPIDDYLKKRKRERLKLNLEVATVFSAPLLLVFATQIMGRTLGQGLREADFSHSERWQAEQKLTKECRENIPAALTAQERDRQYYECEYSARRAVNVRKP